MKKLTRAVQVIKSKVLPTPVVQASTAPGAFIDDFGQSDFKAFYDSVRESFGPLRELQVAGFEAIGARYRSQGIKDNRHCGYMLATTWHETGATMHPITEYGSAKYLRSKRYWPYIGRGFVQLTWANNYAKYGIKDCPERALEMDMAAHILVDGMSKGIFTGRRLDQYFNQSTDDPVGARRIINGTDRAQMVAGYHNKFMKALSACPAFTQPTIIRTPT